MIDSGASTHMLSKRDLSSEEMDNLRRSTTLTVVIAASGEVQTNEEAQVHVQDLGLFVTVRIHEVKPALLSLRKLCEEHGYSHESVSGQQPRLTKKWN